MWWPVSVSQRFRLWKDGPVQVALMAELCIRGWQPSSKEKGLTALGIQRWDEWTTFVVTLEVFKKARGLAGRGGSCL